MINFRNIFILFLAILVTGCQTPRMKKGGGGGGPGPGGGGGGEPRNQAAVDRLQQENERLIDERDELKRQLDEHLAQLNNLNGIGQNILTDNSPVVSPDAFSSSVDPFAVNSEPLNQSSVVEGGTPIGVPTALPFDTGSSPGVQQVGSLPDLGNDFSNVPNPSRNFVAPVRSVASH